MTYARTARSLGRDQNPKSMSASVLPDGPGDSRGAFLTYSEVLESKNVDCAQLGSTSESSAGDHSGRAFLSIFVMRRAVMPVMKSGVAPPCRSKMIKLTMILRDLDSSGRGRTIDQTNTHNTCTCNTKLHSEGITETESVSAGPSHGLK